MSGDQLRRQGTHWGLGLWASYMLGTVPTDDIRLHETMTPCVVSPLEVREWLAPAGLLLSNPEKASGIIPQTTLSLSPYPLCPSLTDGVNLGKLLYFSEPRSALLQRRNNALVQALGLCEH